MFDHFHAEILVKNGRLVGQRVLIEGGFGKKLSSDEWMDVKRLPEVDREKWMKDHILAWLPDDMTENDQFKIIGFRVAG